MLPSKKHFEEYSIYHTPPADACYLSLSHHQQIRVNTEKGFNDSFDTVMSGANKIIMHLVYTCYINNTAFGLNRKIVRQYKKSNYKDVEG